MIKPWSEVKAFYAELVNGGVPVDGMLRLVEAIEQSGFASGVHGETSMHDLCLTQIAASRAVSDPYLRLSPGFDGTIEFRYVDTYIKEKQWHRLVAEDEAFPRLVRFFAELHWFVVERPESSRS